MVKPLTITKYCDRLRSIIVRAPGVCQLAGLDGRTCFGVLQDMHIVGRTDWELRYDWRNNSLCGCQGHHTFYTYAADHVWIQFVQENFPAKAKVCFQHHPAKLKADYYAIARCLENDLKKIVKNKRMHHYYSPADSKLVERIIKGETLCL